MSPRGCGWPAPWPGCGTGAPRSQTDAPICALCWTPLPGSERCRPRSVPPPCSARRCWPSAAASTSAPRSSRPNACDLFEQLGDLSGMSWSHRYLAEAALATDDLTRGRASAEAELDLARRAGDRIAEADAYNMLGQSSVRFGNFDEAEAELLKSEAVFRELGNLDGAASVLDSLAELAFRRWDIGLAATRWGEALELDGRTGNRRGVIYHLEGCAKIMAVNGKPAVALRCLGCRPSPAHLRRLGAPGTGTCRAAGGGHGLGRDAERGRASGGPGRGSRRSIVRRHPAGPRRAP